MLGRESWKGGLAVARYIDEEAYAVFSDVWLLTIKGSATARRLEGTETYLVDPSHVTSIDVMA